MNHQKQVNEEPGGGRRRLLRTALLGFGMPTAGVLGVGAVGTCREAHAETKDRALQFVDVPPGIASLVKSADGTRISVHEYGNPNGRPVVVVHGFSQSRLSWIEQISSGSSFWICEGMASRINRCRLTHPTIQQMTSKRSLLSFQFLSPFLWLGRSAGPWFWTTFQNMGSQTYQRSFS